MIVISYYTDENYRQEGQHLVESCRKFDVPLSFVFVEEQGSWQANTCYKPLFIQEMLIKVGGPVLYLDADARIERDPIPYFERLDCDLAYHIRNKTPLHKKFGDEAMSCTVYVQPSASGMDFMKRWIDLCQQPSQTIWDQRLMEMAHKKTPGLRFHNLPVEYCAIFDGADMPKRPVITQWQASRRFKTADRSK